MAASKETTSPPLPSPIINAISLSDQINIATRSVHAQLNRLILARLPLALPPHTSTPSAYITGLLHVAPIYSTFETLWSALVDEALSAHETQADLATKLTPPFEESSRVISLLGYLNVPGLRRIERLRGDIGILSGVKDDEMTEQLKTVAEIGKLEEFVSHITRSVNANPHVLVAYAWVLYMALFAGGRYLRAMLKEAGGVEEFWVRSPSTIQPYAATTPHSSAMRRGSNDDGSQARPGGIIRETPPSDCKAEYAVPGLSFFHFAGDHDGEDIKVEFKKRMAEADAILTDGEKEVIILEAQHIFRFMVELVGDLDALMGTTGQQSTTVPHRLARKAHQDHLSFRKEPISGTSHDGSMSIPSHDSSVLKDFLNQWKAVILPNKSSSVDMASSPDLVQGKVALTTPTLLVGKAFISFFPIVVIVILFMAWQHLNMETRSLKAFFNLFV